MYIEKNGSPLSQEVRDHREILGSSKQDPKRSSHGIIAIFDGGRAEKVRVPMKQKHCDREIEGERRSSADTRKRGENFRVANVNEPRQPRENVQRNFPNTK